MHDGPPHASERRHATGPSGGRRPIPQHDPIEQLTELFLGDLPGAPLTPLDADDLPLPPLKSEAERESHRSTKVSAAAPRQGSAPASPLDPSASPAWVSLPAAHSVAQPPAHVKMQPADPGPHALAVEVVIVGHLPIAAAAWVHQFARHRQRQHREPVALLRWRGNSVSIDLLSEGAPPRGLVGAPAATLADAITAASSVASHMLVSVDETQEIDLAVTPGVARVTVLTGAYDTAVVSCYRALKGLLQHDIVRDSRCALGVVILGGPQDRALAAAARLEQTSAAYLSHAVVCEVASDKISASRATPLFVGVSDMTAAAAIRPLLADRQLAAPGSPPPAAAPSAPPAQPILAPKFAGLRPIEVRCPFAPAIELAVSGEGEVHILASASQSVDIPRAVADLTVASAWVQTNAQTLKAAIPELARRVGAVSPREHLVTTEPKAVRGLLDSKMKLHAQTDSGGLLDLN